MLEERINLAFCSGFKVALRIEKFCLGSDDGSFWINSRCIVGAEKLINVQMLSRKMSTAAVYAI